MIGKLLPFRRRRSADPAMSDLALVAGCAVRDPAALGALFDRHAADVYRFLGRLRGSAAGDLDDLLQATFVEAQRSASRFGARSSVKTWLFGIAANLARHHARSEHRRQAMLQGLAALPSGRFESPIDAAERRDAVRRLSVALDELSPELREAFVLCEIEDVSGVEAARVLGVRPGTLWRRLHDARQALRRCLDEERL